MSIDRVMQYYKEMNDEKYLYGNIKEYNVRLLERFSWGFVDLFINVKDRHIENIEISADCLNTDLPNRLREVLIGESIYGLNKWLNSSGGLEQDIIDVVEFVKNSLR